MNGLAGDGAIAAAFHPFAVLARTAGQNEPQRRDANVRAGAKVGVEKEILARHQLRDVVDALVAWDRRS